MKKLLAIILSITMLLSMGTVAFADGVDGPMQKAKLTVGINAEFPPFEYYEGEELKGFDIDLMNYIGERIGFNIEFVNMSFDKLIPAVINGDVNCAISAITVTQERETVIDFTTPYLSIGEYENYAIVFPESYKEKNKARIPNPKESWSIFKDVHEPIIEREMFEHVQELVKKQTKRRPPKAGNGEKNMFTGLLYCANCGSKMWYHVRHNKETTYFFSCSNYKGDRGTCENTHYIRADSVEMIVRAELEKLAQIVTMNEDAFANLLEEKVNKDIVKEQKLIEQSIAKATARSQEVSRLYERVYEDNVNGKVTDA